jgi:hypothetical protein
VAPRQAGRPLRDHHGVTQAEYGAACTARVEAGGFGVHLAELSGLMAPCFSRRDLKSNAFAYMRGLLCPGIAGNCWAIAQAVGYDRPYRLQHLLSGALWDEDAVRDHVRGFVARHLGDGGVLIFDETGDLKKGTSTAGASRQYTGTAGRIENAIVAVYATYATPLGHGLVDRDLYVQKEWFADRERMKRAGFPDDHAFATKPSRRTFSLSLTCVLAQPPPIGPEAQQDRARHALSSPVMLTIPALRGVIEVDRVLAMARVSYGPPCSTC